jgi:hypothetical protein
MTISLNAHANRLSRWAGSWLGLVRNQERQSHGERREMPSISNQERKPLSWQGLAARRPATRPKTKE